MSEKDTTEPLSRVRRNLQNMFESVPPVKVNGVDVEMRRSPNFFLSQEEAATIAEVELDKLVASRNTKPRMESILKSEYQRKSRLSEPLSEPRGSLTDVTVNPDFVPSFLDEISIDVDSIKDGKADPRGIGSKKKRRASRSASPPQFESESQSSSASVSPAKSSKDDERKLPPNVIKLFERTICVEGFDEASPLYPLCRAWVANKQWDGEKLRSATATPPRRGLNLDPYPKDSLVTQLWDRHNAGLFDSPPRGLYSLETTPSKTPTANANGVTVNGLDSPVVKQEPVTEDETGINGVKKSATGVPLPLPFHLTIEGCDPKIPELLPPDRKYGDLYVVPPSEDSPGIIAAGDGSEPPVPDLLDCHLDRWRKIRSKWREADRRNQERYADVLDALKRIKRPDEGLVGPGLK